MNQFFALIVLPLIFFLVGGCGMDSDGDGSPDTIDQCPNDPNKTTPGECGCNVAEGTCSAEEDADGDGVLDQDDLCPLDPSKILPGVCGCGKSDVDTDGDKTADCNDACPDDANKTEPGLCNCGVPEGSCANPAPIITASAENAEKGEGKEQAFDGKADTKWLTFDNTGWIQYDFAGSIAKVIRQYSITAANDFPGRDPTAWKLLGSNNGTHWTVVDERSNECFTSRFQKRNFRTNHNSSYEMVRLDVSAVRDPSLEILQLAEIGLQEEDGDGIEPGEDGNCSEVTGAPIYVRATKVGYVTQDEEIVINALPADVVVVMLGGSSGPGGSDPIGGSDMPSQGYRLIKVEGDSDSKIEAWVKIWEQNDGNRVTIPRNAKDVGYGITVLDGGQAQVNASFLDSNGHIATNNGLVKGLNVESKDSGTDIRQMQILPAGGSGLTLAGYFVDDPVLNVEIKDGNANVLLLWTDKGFGDGDSFGFIVMEGDQVNTLTGKGEDGDYKTDYSTMTINFDGWLIH